MYFIRISTVVILTFFGMLPFSNATSPAGVKLHATDPNLIPNQGANGSTCQSRTNVAMNDQQNNHPQDKFTKNNTNALK